MSYPQEGVNLYTYRGWISTPKNLESLVGKGIQDGLNKQIYLLLF